MRVVTDVEVLRLHYAETLRHWEARFQANRQEIAALYDERFCRMWEAYLIGCEMGFRYQGLMVFQIQITKKVDAVPLTRRSEEHTSELQSLMRISYAVFCLKKKKSDTPHKKIYTTNN